MDAVSRRITHAGGDSGLFAALRHFHERVFAGEGNPGGHRADGNGKAGAFRPKSRRKGPRPPCRCCGSRSGQSPKTGRRPYSSPGGRFPCALHVGPARDSAGVIKLRQPLLHHLPDRRQFYGVFCFVFHGNSSFKNRILLYPAFLRLDASIQAEPMMIIPMRKSCTYADTCKKFMPLYKSR